MDWTGVTLVLQVLIETGVDIDELVTLNGFGVGAIARRWAKDIRLPQYREQTPEKATALAEYVIALYHPEDDRTYRCINLARRAGKPTYVFRLDRPHGPQRRFDRERIDVDEMLYRLAELASQPVHAYALADDDG